MQELWLLPVAADLYQADLLLWGTNDLHLANQLQLLIPSDFNENTNIGKPYLIIVCTSRREDFSSGHKILSSLIFKGCQLKTLSVLFPPYSFHTLNTDIL